MWRVYAPAFLLFLLFLSYFPHASLQAEDEALAAATEIADIFTGMFTDEVNTIQGLVNAMEYNTSSYVDFDTLFIDHLAFIEDQLFVQTALQTLGAEIAPTLDDAVPSAPAWPVCSTVSSPVTNVTWCIEAADSTAEVGRAQHVLQKAVAAAPAEVLAHPMWVGSLHGVAAARVPTGLSVPALNVGTAAAPDRQLTVRTPRVLVILYDASVPLSYTADIVEGLGDAMNTDNRFILAPAGWDLHPPERFGHFTFPVSMSAVAARSLPVPPTGPGVTPRVVNQAVALARDANAAAGLPGRPAVIVITAAVRPVFIAEFRSEGYGGEDTRPTIITVTPAEDTPARSVACLCGGLPVQVDPSTVRADLTPLLRFLDQVNPMEPNAFVTRLAHEGFVDTITLAYPLRAGWRAAGLSIEVRIDSGEVLAGNIVPDGLTDRYALRETSDPPVPRARECFGFIGSPPQPHWTYDGGTKVLTEQCYTVRASSVRGLDIEISHHISDAAESRYPLCPPDGPLPPVHPSPDEISVVGPGCTTPGAPVPASAPAPVRRDALVATTLLGALDFIGQSTQLTVMFPSGLVAAKRKPGTTPSFSGFIGSGLYGRVMASPRPLPVSDTGELRHYCWPVTRASSIGAIPLFAYCVSGAGTFVDTVLSTKCPANQTCYLVTDSAGVAAGDSTTYGPLIDTRPDVIAGLVDAGFYRSVPVLTFNTSTTAFITTGLAGTAPFCTRQTLALVPVGSTRSAVLVAAPPSTALQRCPRTAPPSVYPRVRHGGCVGCNRDVMAGPDLSALRYEVNGEGCQLLVSANEARVTVAVVAIGSVFLVSWAVRLALMRYHITRARRGHATDTQSEEGEYDLDQADPTDPTGTTDGSTSDTSSAGLLDEWIGLRGVPAVPTAGPLEVDLEGSALSLTMGVSGSSSDAFMPPEARGGSRATPSPGLDLATLPVPVVPSLLGDLGLALDGPLDDDLPHVGELMVQLADDDSSIAETVTIMDPGPLPGEATDTSSGSTPDDTRPRLFRRADRDLADLPSDSESPYGEEASVRATSSSGTLIHAPIGTLDYNSATGTVPHGCPSLRSSGESLVSATAETGTVLTLDGSDLSLGDVGSVGMIDIW